MDSEANKQAVRDYVEALNAGDFDRLRTLFAPDALIWGVQGGGSMDAVMPIWRDLHQSLRLNLEIVGLCAEGETVAARYVERGTWVGPIFGRNNPTGRSFELTAMEWFVLESGRIKTRWGARDAANLFRQIGMPA